MSQLPSTPSSNPEIAPFQSDPGYPKQCPVCGNKNFSYNSVLWPELIAAMKLTPAEIQLLNRQQGICCGQCGSNLRCMTLAAAIANFFKWSGNLQTLAQDPNHQKAKIFEINEAGPLHSVLQQFRNYEFASYPEIDMQQINRPDRVYDLVIHSDTLEHIYDPVRGLRECHRILRPAGSLLMTIPILPTRLTLRRYDLPPSYHGSDANSNDDMRVWTEYGADFYADLIAAGWNAITLSTLGTMDSIAICATK